MSSPYKIGAVINQRYKLEKEIGRGGMESVIYLATDQSITNDRYLEMKRKKVAIKIVCKKDFTDDDDREEK
jgi:serine/threonine protein kinase